MKRLEQEYSSVSYSRIFEQNHPEFFIPVLKSLGRKTGRIFLDKAAAITTIKHRYILHAKITHELFTTTIKSEETAGNLLLADASSVDIRDWTCCDLLEKATKTSTHGGIMYHTGILNGSIHTHSCEPQKDCPTCGGSGICQECNKAGVITCPDCSGDKQCNVCCGKGNVSCPDCDGSGIIACDDCNGTGEEDCYMCDGTGNCTVCDGTGEKNGKSCRRCHGSGTCNRCHGRSTFYCKSCGGTGVQTCDNCNDDNEVTCPTCNGSGHCATCNGEGIVVCPTCHHSGECPDCNGSGSQTCSRCNGTGSYQTYKTYTVLERHSEYRFSSWLDNDHQQLSYTLKGLAIHDDWYYIMDSGTVIRNDIDTLFQKADQDSDFKNWIRDISPTRSLKALKSKAQLEHIPVTEVFYKIGKNEFSFFIVGTNNVIIYTKLPTLINSYLGIFK